MLKTGSVLSRHLSFFTTNSCLTSSPRASNKLVKEFPGKFPHKHFLNILSVLIFFRLVTQGFNSGSDSARSSITSESSFHQSNLPRIPVSSPLLIELLHIVYHAAERCASAAIQALHDISQRANYESYAGIFVTKLKNGYVGSLEWKITGYSVIGIIKIIRLPVT